jgi:hypothetical protein
MNMDEIKFGDQVYVEEGGAECGAVREVRPADRPELVVYVENFGEVIIPLAAVAAVHDGKVILDCAKLDDRARAAVLHAHDAEQPGL